MQIRGEVLQDKMSSITIDDFKKIEIRIGKVISAEKVKDTDKLIRLEIDFGTEKRQVLTGMAEFFKPEYFIGKEIPVLINLEPKKIKGLQSQGMILAVDGKNGKPVLLHPEKEVPAGNLLR